LLDGPVAWCSGAVMRGEFALGIFAVPFFVGAIEKLELWHGVFRACNGSIKSQGAGGWALDDVNRRSDRGRTFAGLPEKGRGKRAELATGIKCDWEKAVMGLI
jgi:hypothetical protein